MAHFFRYNSWIYYGTRLNGKFATTWGGMKWSRKGNCRVGPRKKGESPELPKLIPFARNVVGKTIARVTGEVPSILRSALIEELGGDTDGQGR